MVEADSHHSAVVHWAVDLGLFLVHIPAVAAVAV
jgi:hypothetical protein